MKVVLIGAGNVASHLGAGLYNLGYTIAQVYSRTMNSAQELATAVKASPTNNISEIITDADCYIFSVKDDVLGDLIAQTPDNKGIWIHTAGSMPLDIFANRTKNYGVIYPLQTFSKDKKIEWDNIPLFIEYSNKESKKTIESLANELSNQIFTLTSEQRKYVHLSGVFACNFVNQMYELANQMIEKVQLPFEVLLPIIEETCIKVHTMQPKEAQTGPAIRFDQNVMNKHLDLIADEDTKALYRLISKSIYDSHKSKK